MRVAIYARVSTKEQQVETQLVCLRLYCEARGYEVTKEYVDAGISGFKPEDKRPALSELMNEARKQRIHAVIVWRFDRFARSSKHLIEALSEFQSSRNSVHQLSGEH
jgi:DNA invertase Pin-like site-specific DNA recombinase